jgi:hypothetical protein
MGLPRRPRPRWGGDSRGHPLPALQGHCSDKPLEVDSIARELLARLSTDGTRGALSSAFDRFPCPFLEILRRPEVRCEGKLLLLRGVAVVAGPRLVPASPALLAHRRSLVSLFREEGRGRRPQEELPRASRLGGHRSIAAHSRGRVLRLITLAKKCSFFFRKPTACCDEVGPRCVILYTGIWRPVVNAQTGAVCIVPMGMERSSTSRQRSEKSHSSLQDRPDNLITHIFAGAGFPRSRRCRDSNEGLIMGSELRH